jgi:hypothetical protein
MNKGGQDVNGDRGIALIVAMLSLLVLSTLGMELLFVTQTSIRTSYNFKLLTQARYAAEAGSQSAVNWLVYSYSIDPSDYSQLSVTTLPITYHGMTVMLSAMTGQTANYPVNAQQTAFDAALREKSVPGADVTLTYSVTATLQSMRLITPIGSGTQKPLQSWLIRSQGSVAGSLAQVEVTTTIERLGNSAFSYAAFGKSDACGAVSFSNGSSTDSYDSRVGNYLTTHLDSNGDIGSNGNISVDSSTLVRGNGSSPYSASGGSCTTSAMTGVTLNDGATLGYNITMLTTPSKVSVPTPDPPPSTPPTTAHSTTGTCGTISGCTTLSGTRNLAFAAGDYDNLSIGGGTTIHLSAGTYNINSLSVAGGSSLVIDSGPVILNIAGTNVTGTAAVVSFTGGSTISNTAGRPSDLQMVYGGSQPVSLMGGASTYGVVYAPNAALTIAGGSDWYGSLIANTITNASGTFIHYERALAANLLSMGNYHIT